MGRKKVSKRTNPEKTGSPVVSFYKRYGLFLLFVIFILLFILPIFTGIDTYLHERAHQKQMTVAGVNTEIHMRWLDLTFFGKGFWNPSFTGETSFSTPEDKERFLALTKEERFPIFIAGILSDLHLASIIVALLIFMNAIPWVLKGNKKFEKWYAQIGQRMLLSINTILAVWAVSLILSTISNMTVQNADIPLALLLG